MTFLTENLKFSEVFTKTEMSLLGIKMDFHIRMKLSIFKCLSPTVLNETMIIYTIYEINVIIPNLFVTC